MSQPPTSSAVPPDASLLDGEVSLESSGLDNASANAMQTENTGRSVARATFGIVPLHFLRFVIGFLAQPLIAHSAGLTWQADAYAVATDIVQRLWLIFEKVVNPAFLPGFGRALAEEGEERAWKLASTALWLVALALLVATPLAWLLMPAIVNIYTPLKPAMTPEQIATFGQERVLTVSIARLLLTGLFFLGMSSMTYVILNGYKRFKVAAFGDVLWKLGVFGGAAAAYALYGGELRVLLNQAKDAQLSTVQNAQLTDITSKSLLIVSIGFVLGAVFKLLPQLLAIGRKWKLLRLQINLRDPLVKTMLTIAIPLVLGIVVSETRGVYLMRLTNEVGSVDGARAAIKWSRIVGDNLIQIFPYALSIGIFPFLAEQARQRDTQPLTDTLMGALRVCVFVFGPLTAILIALRFPLLRAVWESGRLTQADTIAMSGPFIGFTIGLIAFACEMMLNQTFYAMFRAWTPTLMGLAATVLWVTIATLGVRAGWGLAAIALAESVSKSVKCLLMWTFLRPKLGDVKARENLLFVLKVAGGAIVAAAVAGVVAQQIAPGDGASHFKIKMLMAVTFAGCSGLVIYIALGALVGVREVRSILNFAGKLRKRLRPA